MLTLLRIGLALGLLSVSASPLSAGRPNVVVILADKLGYGDVGFNGGGSIPTPDLNRTAAGGVVAANAYMAGQNNSTERVAPNARPGADQPPPLTRSLLFPKP